MADLEQPKQKHEPVLHTLEVEDPPFSPEWYCSDHGQSLLVSRDQLICSKGHSFPIVNGIPRFVPSTSYADPFGAQWNRYRLTQLDSYTGQPITRDRVRRCLGENIWNDLRGKEVLECGCGAGRFTEVLLATGAKVTSIDLSSAVDANALNCPIDSHHRIAQADILQLPFSPQQFDLVLCLGVIQHTPKPQETVAQLYRQVAPGGALVLDHYTYQIGWYTKTSPLFRAFLKRLPPQKGIAAAERLVDLFLPSHKRAATRSRLARALVNHMSPVVSYYTVFPELDDDLQREWALLDTHDSLTDWFKHFRTRGQIQRILEKLGAENIWCEYGGNGVEARACRPQ
jgi:SAM-dependent methyltransferase